MKCKICGHSIGNRRRVGPTGKKIFMILIDSCNKCGTMYPVEKNKLTYLEKRWVERYNLKMKKNWEKENDTI